MSIRELVDGGRGLRIAGRCIEPTVSAEQLLAAIPESEVESLRPLLPVGYDAVAESYRRAAASISTDDLTRHYTQGIDSFHLDFVPWLRECLGELSGGQWNLEDYQAFAAGSDCDLMSHLIEAIACNDPVCLYPGDWYGFSVGCTHQRNIHWRRDAANALACLCIPSVRNGHVADEMIQFLESASSCLLNLNLFPTLDAHERHDVAARLVPMLPKSVLSISFSRGFGLTASQLGVIFIHRDHPFRKRFEVQWNWFTYFYNAIAVRAFQSLDLGALQSVDVARRNWVSQWLQSRGFPDVSSGSYYVKSFLVENADAVPKSHRCLLRDNVLRLCMKPPIT